MVVEFTRGVVWHCGRFAVVFRTTVWRHEMLFPRLFALADVGVTQWTSVVAFVERRAIFGLEMVLVFLLIDRVHGLVASWTLFVVGFVLAFA